MDKSQPQIRYFKDEINALANISMWAPSGIFVGLSLVPCNPNGAQNKILHQLHVAPIDVGPIYMFIKWANLGCKWVLLI